MALASKAISTVASSGLNIGDAINVAVGVSDYKNARQQGDSKGKSIVKAGASFAWGEFYYGGLSAATSKVVAGMGIGGPVGAGVALLATTAVMMAPAAASVASAAAANGSKVRTAQWTQRGGIGSGYFNMSEAGYTMRQRSLNAIRQNGMNAQSVLGNEARTYYRGSY